MSQWEVRFDVTGFSGFFVKTLSTSLPLRLLNFKANRDNRMNHLKWKTSNEINTKEFVIERSIDGKSFSGIGTVDAISFGSNSYYYADPTNIIGKIFYRLKMTDLDGKFTYSNTLTITNSEPGFVKVFPIPVKEKAMIQFESKKLTGTSASLLDINGKELIKVVLRNNFEVLDMTKLSAGLYLLQFGDGTTIKVIKK